MGNGDMRDMRGMLFIKIGDYFFISYYFFIIIFHCILFSKTT